MPRLELTPGVIDYEDTGDDGPVLVLLGGLVMDGSVWDPVVDELSPEHRCIVPTLPLGAHRQPMRPDADLSLEGFGTMVGELLEGMISQRLLTQYAVRSNIGVSDEQLREAITSIPAFQDDGRFSMARFFPGASISKIHGQPRRIDNTIYFPMYHPAAALHRSDLMATVKADMLKIPALLQEARTAPQDGADSPTAQEEAPVQLGLFDL